MSLTCGCSGPGSGESKQIFYRRLSLAGYDGVMFTVQPATASLGCAVMTVLAGGFSGPAAVDAGVELWPDGYWHPYLSSYLGGPHYAPLGTPIPGDHAVRVTFSVPASETAQMIVRDVATGAEQTLSMSVPAVAWYPGSPDMQVKVLAGLVPATATSSGTGEPCSNFQGSATVEITDIALTQAGAANAWVPAFTAACDECPSSGYAIATESAGGTAVQAALSTAGNATEPSVPSQQAPQPVPQQAQSGQPLWPFLVGGGVAVAMVAGGVVLWRRARG